MPELDSAAAHLAPDPERDARAEHDPGLGDVVEGVLEVGEVAVDLSSCWAGMPDCAIADCEIADCAIVDCDPGCL